MDVRSYLPLDRDACLGISSPEDRAEFAEFLDKVVCPYFVMAHDDAIVGCGGYRLDQATSSAQLIWGMVDSAWRRRGLGRFLLLFRLREISKAGGVQMVFLVAPEEAAGFFERQGFKFRRGVPPRGVEMSMKLTVCP